MRLERHGKRLTYSQDTFVDVLHHDTPVHGSRPFQYVHIDHTQLDIELISRRTGENLGRPWLTLAIDTWSRRIVGFYLTFDPPSYRSITMVVRDIVIRHQRLPEFFVVDNGKEFMSEAFELFLNSLGTHLRFRPAGQPRHGAVMERIFGRCHSEYVHNLAGNTKAMKNVRMTTGSHLPVNFAEWTLESMYFGLSHWAFEYYDTAIHPALDETPRAAFIRGQHESGARAHRQILPNRDFRIQTCPPVDRGGERHVNQQRGVKVNDHLYWAPELADPKVRGRSWPVRYDPWDASSVYVNVGERWIHARCRALAKLTRMTELERRVVTAEYTNSSKRISSPKQAEQRLREFLQTFTPTGALALEMERQEENKSLYSSLGMGAIDSSEPARTSGCVDAIPVPVTAQHRIAPVTETDNFSSLHQEVDFDDLPDFETF